MKNRLIIPCRDHPLAIRKLYKKKIHFKAQSIMSKFDKNAKALFSFAAIFFNKYNQQFLIEKK